ncbi:mechanosensitive ion channel family protein [Patescibacteria group bacterium]
MNQFNFHQDLISWFLSHGVKIILILFSAFLISRFGRIFVQKIIRRMVKPNPETKDRKDEKKREDTLIRIFNSILSILIWVTAIVVILPEFGINIIPLLAGAGLVGLAIGMGAKDMIADFIAGIFIVLEDQYRIGDSVKVAGIEGEVLDLNLRRTIVIDKEGIVSSIPNGQIKISAKKTL